MERDKVHQHMLTAHEKPWAKRNHKTHTVNLRVPTSYTHSPADHVFLPLASLFLLNSYLLRFLVFLLLTNNDLWYVNCDENTFFCESPAIPKTVLRSSRRSTCRPSAITSYFPRNRTATVNASDEFCATDSIRTLRHDQNQDRTKNRKSGPAVAVNVPFILFSWCQFFGIFPHFLALGPIFSSPADKAGTTAE